MKVIILNIQTSSAGRNKSVYCYEARDQKVIKVDRS